MQVEISDITPEMAGKLLAANTRNRRIRPTVVEAYKRDMVNGNWPANGDSIKVAVTGEVIDGQHRLTAAFEADFTLRSIVLITGLPLEAQDTTDIGVGRTSADQLTLRGIGNSNLLASVGRRVWQWETGNIKFQSRPTPTKPELLAFVMELPRLQRSAEIGARVNQSFRAANATVTGTVHHIFTAIDPATSAEFFGHLETGAGLDEFHPVLTLRNRLMRDRDNSKKMPFHVQAAYYIKAWNALRADEPLSTILMTAENHMPRPQ